METIFINYDENQDPLIRSEDYEFLAFKPGAKEPFGRIVNIRREGRPEPLAVVEVYNCNGFLMYVPISTIRIGHVIERKKRWFDWIGTADFYGRAQNIVLAGMFVATIIIASITWVATFAAPINDEPVSTTRPPEQVSPRSPPSHKPKPNHTDRFKAPPPAEEISIRPWI